MCMYVIFIDNYNAKLIYLFKYSLNYIKQNTFLCM